MINASDFTFCGENISNYSYVIASIDNSSSVENVICGNIEILTERPPLSRKDISHGFNYGEGLIIKFHIIKLDEYN